MLFFKIKLYVILADEVNLESKSSFAASSVLSMKLASSPTPIYFSSTYDVGLFPHTEALTAISPLFYSTQGSWAHTVVHQACFFCTFDSSKF